MFAALTLAGCGAKSSAPAASAARPALPADRGAVKGIVIDDRYRPVPEATVLLTPVGLTSTTDAEGLFAFTDLAPGAYVVLVQAKDHEAAPKNVDVQAGQYTEVEAEARRIFSDAGAVITTQFSAFIPCAANFVANGVIFNCVLDLSGDSFRGGFTTKAFNKTLNWTVMVSEVLVNQPNSYEFQVREDDGSSGGGERYAVGPIQSGVYKKITNLRGILNMVDNQQRNNVPFNGTKPFATILFLEGDHQQDFQQAFDTVCQPSVPQTCRTATGVGAAFGIKAKMVQSLFVGAPATPVEHYCVLAPDGCA